MDEHLTSAVTVIIGGDVEIEGKNDLLFRQDDPDAIWGDVSEKIKHRDLFIVNLEAPFIREYTPIIKAGPVFGVDPACIRGIVHSGIDGVNLANNHIMDNGEKGLDTTRKLLQENGIFYFGVGENITEARKVHIRTVKGKRIGLLGMADQEFSIADKNRPGANPSDVISFVRTVRELRSDLDYLVVLLHEGVQHFRFPTPELQKRCRFMIEEGADAVICQHSHCSGCYEIYQGRPIVYGQGDLISDSTTRARDDTGFFVKLTLADQVQFSIVPYLQLTAGGIRAMSKEEEDRYIEALKQRNLMVIDPDILEVTWRKYCQQHRDTYYVRITGYNRIFRFLNRKLHFIERLSVQKVATLLNTMHCSAHQEAMVTILSDILSEKSG